MREFSIPTHPGGDFLPTLDAAQATRRRGAVAKAGAIAAASAMTLASCAGSSDTTSGQAGATQEGSGTIACEFNGREGDPDPVVVSGDEATRIFSGVMEADGLTHFRPVVALGEQGVAAAFDLRFDEGEVYVSEIPDEVLGRGVWKVDRSKVDPEAPENSKAFDGCEDPMSRTVPVSAVTLEGTVDMHLLTNPHLAVTAANFDDGSTPFTPNVTSLPDSSLYGIALGAEDAAGLPEIYSSVSVPLNPGR